MKNVRRLTEFLEKAEEEDFVLLRRTLDMRKITEIVRQMEPDYPADVFLSVI